MKIKNHKITSLTADDLPEMSCEWFIDDMGKYFRCCSSDRVMNDMGYYVGYVRFAVIVDKKLDRFPAVRFSKWEYSVEFRLRFNGKDSGYLARKHLLRDYLENKIDNYLHEAKTEAGG